MDYTQSYQRRSCRYASEARPERYANNNISKPESAYRPAQERLYDRIQPRPITYDLEGAAEDALPLVRLTPKAKAALTERHEDLITSAQEPKSGAHLRDHLVVCVYHNSSKVFQCRRVRLVTRDRRDYRWDVNFFKELHITYRDSLRNRARRILSFKSVSTVRLIEYGSDYLGSAKQNGALFSPKFVKVLQNPYDYLGPKDTKWTEWFCTQKDKLRNETGMDLALELIEDYNSIRVFGVVILVLASLLTLSIVWVLEGGDAAYMSTVMSFVLTFLAAMIALTGLWDWLDKGHMQAAYESLVQDKDDDEFMDELARRLRSP